MNRLLRPRNWEPACGTERSGANANNMAILPGVLGCCYLRRTIQARLGTNPLRLRRVGKTRQSAPNAGASLAISAGVGLQR